MPESAHTLRPAVFWLLFALIALAGAALRIGDHASFRGVGFDEVLYRRYVNMMDGGVQTVGVFQKDHSMRPYRIEVQGTGAGAMPDMTGFFLDTQKPEGTECELPPTRFLYIYLSWLWKRAQFGETPPLSGEEMRAPPARDDRSRDADHRDPALASLHRVACLFTILLMLAGGLCAWRMAGQGVGLAVLALMALDPVQLHFSQHALIDGFFTFWAMMCLWTTWECLQNPASPRWLLAHGACLALMVMTKENSFFVYCALGAAVVASRWLKFGSVTPRFLAVSIAGPGIGVLLLALLAGGVGSFIEVYSTLVAKAQNLPYARLTGDGPWQRYIMDLLAVSPLVVLLALGACFRLVPGRRELAFVAVFVSASYLIMCNVRYGMNLRYASIWEFPLRLCAVAMLVELCRPLAARQWLGVTVATVALCALELRTFTTLATDEKVKLYELVPNDLLRLLKVLKRPEDLAAPE